jgi:hypothetical protein
MSPRTRSIAARGVSTTAAVRGSRGDERAGTQPRLDFSEEPGGVGEQFRRDGPALRPHALGLVTEPPRADVVAADDDVGEINEREPREGVECGDDAHGVDRPAAQGRQTRHQRRGDAPLRPDEPETYSRGRERARERGRRLHEVILCRM